MSQFNQSNPGVPLTAYQKTVKNCKDLIDAGQYQSAVGLLKSALAQSPRDVLVLRMLGHALMMIDYRDEALRHMIFASKLDPQNVELLCDLSSAHRRMDQLGKAHKTIDAALKIFPTHPRSVITKAKLLQSHAQAPQAFEIVEKAVEANFDATLLGTYGQLCRELKYQQKGIDALNRGLELPAIPRVVRQDILFTTGHLYDSIGEYDKAFECFHKGNSMSAEANFIQFDKYVERWDKEKYQAMPGTDIDGSRAVFIVGMPRSGTTLTEQIIATHPSAGGVGESQLIDTFTRHHELEDYDQKYVDAAGKAYLAMLNERFPEKSIKRVCDKMPENFYFGGFIKKVLPGSHIIHCKRDPIDTCLSIYFQRFGPRLEYATDLEVCGKQYLVYEKVIEHLTNNLGVTMQDAVYEETTSKPEESIRSMLEFVGLPFDPVCMDFHKSKKSVHTASSTQIRQPMYTTSTQRWKNYEKHIGPLLEALSPLIDG
tara:strand:+ start:97205 stop:98656 length:1452 start_codon:yes stop_codon:yes gene_type:complete